MTIVDVEDNEIYTLNYKLNCSNEKRRINQA